MKPRKIKDGIYWMGALHYNRKLFDCLIPLPDGTSYNAYLIKGRDKTALLDTVDPGKVDILVAQLEGIDRIDYIISHHAEQDHSGAIPYLLERYSDAKVVTSTMGKRMLMDLLLIPDERCIEVKDGDSLDLGGRRLTFIYTPWVHWPETMVSYLEEDRILFTCDFFGSHIASTDLFASKNEPFVYSEAKRYYATIMMPFKKTIIKNLEKIASYDFKMIAPSHGPIYDNPGFIIDAYKRWASDVHEDLVLIPYISMHGSTEVMVEYLSSCLVERGRCVEVFELTHTDIGKLATSLVDAITVVFGTPVMLGGAHPEIVSTAYTINILKPDIKNISLIGSYGWGARVMDQIKGIISNIKPEIIDPVLCKGFPRQDVFKALEELSDRISRAHEKLLEKG